MVVKDSSTANTIGLAWMKSGKYRSNARSKGSYSKVIMIVMMTEENRYKGPREVIILKVIRRFLYRI